MLGHVGAAHAGRPGRAGSPIQSARAGNLEKRAPGPDRSNGACRSPPGRQHLAPPVVARGSAEAGRPSPSRLGADGRSRRTGRALAPGGGTSGLAQRQGRGPTLGAQAHSPLVRDSGRRARTRRFTHCALPWRRPTPGRSNAEPPVRTLQSERLALGSADANGTNRSDGRPAGRHAPMPPSRMTVVVAHSRARVRRAPAARGDDADVDAPLCCSRSCCCAGALAALRPCWLRCTALAATGCSGLLPVATGCGRLQQVVMHCNRLSRAATDRAGCAVTMLLRCAALAATGCTGLRSVAKGCARLQRTALHCNRVRCGATGSAAVCGTLWLHSDRVGCAALQWDHWCLHCVVLAAPGCGKVWSVAPDGPALHQAPLNCNQQCCYLWHTVAAL